VRAVPSFINKTDIANLSRITARLSHSTWLPSVKHVAQFAITISDKRMTLLW